MAGEDTLDPKCHQVIDTVCAINIFSNQIKQDFLHILGQCTLKCTGTLTSPNEILLDTGLVLVSKGRPLILAFIRLYVGVRNWINEVTVTNSWQAQDKSAWLNIQNKTTVE